MFCNQNNILLFISLTSYVAVDLSRSMSFGYTKTGKSFVNEAGPAPVSSRFLDLGGVIRQLFPGFNQGAPGGSPGLNFPPNSQFYPAVLPQGFNAQTPAPIGYGNMWPNNLQGSNYYGGLQNQQQLNRPPNSLNFNSQTLQNEGRPFKQVQDVAQILNIQNNNDLRPDLVSPSSNNSRFQRSEWNQNPESPHEGEDYGSLDTRNEGTLEDFFTTENTNINDDGNVMFPKQDDQVPMRTTTKNAIWGKTVSVPTTTISSDVIVFLDDEETPSQKECVQNCPTTSEYNPVCGSDSVTYFNPGRLLCARNCGLNVRQTRIGSCASNSG
ncbi:uncharacterized protein LOC114363471 isoform X1 [Ostrinia furnacalis]|uniref:uncharacterized protein LOC114363471 isoform X1 n=2 Tax=Ostrinia furnacalis TaxID=93504 RepID=UPI001038CB7C|nr:uncharacterized protein LOC114363471 isoform X1 [Ostrinia furnacalis]